MIYQLIFADKSEYATAKNQLHLLQSYEDEYGGFQEILEVKEISEEEAKTIMLLNTEYDEANPQDMPEYLPLYDEGISDNFCVIGSTDWV
jgi:hypothetical protein